MARMSIDDMLGRDPRLLRLAKLCGLSKHEVAGRLVLDVWPLCYDRERPELPVADIDIAAGIDGFAQMMCDVGLATSVKGEKVRINGARDRIKYLQAKREAGYKGGLKSGEARGKEGKQTGSKPEAEGKQTASKPQAPGNPIPPSPPPASVPPKEEAPAPPPLVLIPESPRPKSDQQYLTDLFFERFERSYGTKPTWTDRQAGQIAGLLKKHPIAELIARIDFMFSGKADWPKPPYTLDTFVTNIDRWIPAGADTAKPAAFRKIPKL